VERGDATVICFLYYVILLTIELILLSIPCTYRVAQIKIPQQTLVLAVKRSSRNSKGFTPNEGELPATFKQLPTVTTERWQSWWEWGRKYSQFLANKSLFSETVQGRIKVTSLTNRKSHAPFRLVPKSTTLDDLERPIRTLLQKKMAFGANTKIWMKIDPYYRRQNITVGQAHDSTPCLKKTVPTYLLLFFCQI